MATDKTKRKSEYDDVYEINNQAWHAFNVRACLNMDFYQKAQHTSDEVDRADKQNRRLYTFDKVSRQVNLLHGYEIRNRHILKIGPVGNFEEQEDEACNQHTGIVMSDMSRNDGYDTLSEAFKWGPLVQGHNLVEQWRDRDGQLQFGRLGFSQFLLGNGLTKTDLSDCPDILTGQWITSGKVKMMVPTEADRIDEIEPLTSSSRWEFQAQPAMQNKAKLRMFEQWWHRETVEVPMVQNTQTGEKVTFKEFKQEVLQKFGRNETRFVNTLIKEVTDQSGQQMFIKVREIQDKVRLTIFLDDEFLWEGDNPLGMKDFNYTWVHGNWCPEATQSDLRLQSFVDGIIDPQRALNRRVNQIIDIIESSVQGIRTVRADKLLNPEDTMKSGQGITLFVKDGSDNVPLEQIFQQKPGNEVQQSLFAALEMVDKAETEVGGLNQEIFGSDDKDIPGVLHQYRTGQALTGQAWLFQAFRASKRDLGRKHVQLVQLNYDPQRIQKILNQPPVQGFYDEDLTKFDCSPTEGLLTDSQQNLYYQELKELLREFPDKFGHVITAKMLVTASPTQYKAETLKAIEQAEQSGQQARQAQQQSAQTTEQLTQALTAVQVSQAQENVADAQEKRSQIPLNNAKTMTEINKNLAAADASQIAPLIDLIKEQVRLGIAELNQQNRQAQNAGQGVVNGS